MYVGQLESVEQVHYPQKIILKKEKKTFFRDSNVNSQGLFLSKYDVLFSLVY